MPRTACAVDMSAGRMHKQASQQAAAATERSICSPPILPELPLLLSEHGPPIPCVATTLCCLL
jgi:hypothetical protein